MAWQHGAPPAAPYAAAASATSGRLSAQALRTPVLTTAWSRARRRVGTASASVHARRSKVRAAVALAATGGAAAAARGARRGHRQLRGQQQDPTRRPALLNLDQEVRLRAPGAPEGGSRIVAVVGPDGVGKSKLCAALLEPAAPAAPADADAVAFADKARLLEEAPAERQRNFSCYNHVYSLQRPSELDDYSPRLHLIDTPGHMDRLPLVERALRAAHGAVLVCSVKGGVDAVSGRIGRTLLAVERFEKPSVIFLNGVDQADDAAGFEAALNVLEQRLGVRPVVLFAPAHVSGAAMGSVLLNVLNGTLCGPHGCSMVSDGDGKVGRELADWAAKLRLQQIRSLAQVDEEMSEAFDEFAGEVPGILIEAALHRAVSAGRIMPLVAGSARSGLGIDALQESLCAFVPAGNGKRLVERLGIQPVGSVEFSLEAPFLGLVFAERYGTMDENLLEVRVLDGTLRPGQQLKVVTAKGEVEAFTLAHLLAHGLRGELDRLQAAGPGDLALVPVPASVGHLHATGPLVIAAAERDFVLGGGLAAGVAEDWHSTGRGHCTFELLLDDLGDDEREKILRALDVILCDEDGLLLETDEQTGARLLYTMGTFHLELLRERLAEEFSIEHLSLGPPRVCYRATLRQAAEACAEVSDLRVELLPGERGTGVVVEDAAASLESGLRSGLQAAGPGGIPVVDVLVRVAGGEAAGQDAASDAARCAAASAGLALLEPIVQLEVDVPADAVEAVVQDLQERRGLVWGARPSEGQALVVDADVPLREILDYGAVLDRLTGGFGFFKHRRRGYRDVPEALERQILAGELAASSAT